MIFPPINASLAACLNSRKGNGNHEDDTSAVHARIQARSGATGRVWSAQAVLHDATNGVQWERGARIAS